MPKHCTMTLLNITQTETFNTTTHDIYTILLDDRRHASFTGDFVQISDKENESLSLCDGEVVGKNVVLERGKKIIWSLKFTANNWPQNHWSEAAIVLTETDEEACQLELFHTAIPDEFIVLFETMWARYWESLRYYLER